MIFKIEKLGYEELSSFLRLQAQDAFPDLKDEGRLKTFAEKWSVNADCSTCRDDEGNLIGMIAFYANRPEEAVVYIPHVYVRGEYRGNKVFSTMLRLIDTYAKKKNYLTMRLEVKKINEIAQIAYSHYGFVITGDATEDSYYMQYQISTT